MMVECTSPLKGQLAADVNPPSCLRLNTQELTISRCGDLDVMCSYVRLWAKAQLWVQKSSIQTLNQELLFLGWFCLFIHSNHVHKRDEREVRMSHQCRCTVPSSWGDESSFKGLVFYLTLLTMSSFKTSRLSWSSTVDFQDTLGSSTFFVGIQYGIFTGEHEDIKTASVTNIRKNEPQDIG